MRTAAMASATLPKVSRRMESATLPTIWPYSLPAALVRSHTSPTGQNVLEEVLRESIDRSPHRAASPEEADFFYVPIAFHWGGRGRASAAAVLAYLRAAQPFFNRSLRSAHANHLLTFTGDLGMDVGRRFLAGSSTKAQPKRSNVPTYSGTISAEFKDLTDYNKFVNGTTFGINASWNGANIEGAYNYEFVVSLPTCKFTGSTPVASLDDLTMVELPFICLQGPSTNAVEWTYTSTDTSL